MKYKYNGHICRIEGLQEPYPFKTFTIKDNKVKEFIPNIETKDPEVIQLYEIKNKDNKDFYYCLSGLAPLITKEEGEFKGDIVEPISKSLNNKLRDYQKDAVKEILTNKRGIVSIPTGGGKTFVIGELITYFPTSKLLVLVPTTTLLYQTIDEISKYIGEEVGQIGDGKVKIKRVNIAIPDTLYTRLEEFKEYLKGVNVLIADEVHLMITPTICVLSKYLVNTYYKVGLSATPALNNLSIGLFGNLIYNLEVKNLIDLNHIEKPIVRVYNCSYKTNNKRLLQLIANRNLKKKDGTFDHFNYEYLLDLVINKNPDRNELICNLVEEFISLGSGLLVVSRVKEGSHADILKKKLNDRIPTLDIPILKGNNTSKTNLKILDSLNKGSNPVVISGPNSIREGTNIPSIQWIILALAGKGGEEGRSLIQQIGRALRKNSLSNKRPVIVIIKDNTWPFNNQAITQIEIVKTIYGEDCIEYYE
jgi:superfamily II DNA or RNA helicase